MSAAGQKRTVFFDDFEGDRHSWQGPRESYPIRRGDGLTGTGGLTHARKSGDQHCYLKQPLPLEKGKTYRLSAMCRMEGARNAKGEIPAAARMMVLEFFRDGKWLSHIQVNLPLVDGDCDWTEAATEFAVPEAADKTTLLLTFPRSWSCRLAAWDNVTVEEVGEAPPIIYPVLPKMLRLDREGRIKFCVYHGGVRNDKDLRLFAAYDSEKTFSAPVENGFAEIRIPELPPGRYDVQLKLADTAAKKIIAESEFPFVMPAGPAPAYAVGVDESGRLMVDGRRFFPIMITFERPDTLDTPKKADIALNRLRDAGFNTVLIGRSIAMNIPGPKTDEGTSESYLKGLDTFARYGLKVAPSLGPLTGTKPNRSFKSFDGLTDRAEIATRLVESIRHHPAVLGYPISDEEPLDKLSPIIKLRFRLSELDPYHPTLTCTNLAPNYPHYGPTGDVLRIDRYPISNDKTQSMSNVRECLEMWQQNSGLGHWLIVQGFNWGIYKKGQKYEEFRYPTEQEIRSICLLGLNFRSRGVSFYAYESIFIWQERRDPGSSKWFWPRVANAATLLRELEPFFLADAAPAPVKLASTGVSKVEAKLHTAGDGKKIVVVTSDGPGKGEAILDVGIDGLKSRFGFTRPLGGGRYEFKAENIAADLLEP